MDRPLNEENINSKKILKHSALGISAFVLSIFTLIFVTLLVIGISASIGTSASGKSSPILGLIFFICVIPSTVLAIVDLTQSNRKKVLPILALIFSWGWIVLSIIGAIIAGIIYNSYIS